MIQTSRIASGFDVDLQLGGGWFVPAINLPVEKGIVDVSGTVTNVYILVDDPDWDLRLNVGDGLRVAQATVRLSDDGSELTIATNKPNTDPIMILFGALKGRAAPPVLVKLEGEPAHEPVMAVLDNLDIHSESQSGEPLPNGESFVRGDAGNAVSFLPAGAPIHLWSKAPRSHSTALDKLRRTSWRLLLPLASLLLVAACGSSKSFAPGTTKGMILIESPQVLTRGSLIEDRVRENAWLKRKLDQSDSVKFNSQAEIARRNLEGLSASLSGTLAAKPSPLVNAEEQLKLKRLSMVTKLAELDYEIAWQKKMNELKALKSDSTSTHGSNDSGGNSETPQAGNEGDAANTDATVISDEKVGKLAVDTSAVSGLFGLLEKPSGSASASPIDDLREQMAYREEIRDEIFRNALDDRHDLNGNTVYRLTFSATVLPENDTSAWAVIHMTLVPPKDPGDTDVLFDTWVQNIYKTMRLELDRRLWDASEDDRLLALKSLYAGTHDLLPDDSLEMRRAIETEILTGRPWEAPVTPTAVIAREIYVSAVLEDLIDEFGLRDFVTLQRPAGGGKVFWLSPRDGGKDKFAGIVRGDHEYFSYAVTPRESVQRITDTITSREYSELGLAFSGLLGSAGTKALLDRIKVSELAAATIKRQPLVVGFGGLPGSAVDGGTFGWVLGPRITTASDGKKVLYRHAAAGYSLAALVSVPATWNSVELRIDCCWVTEAGDTLSERKSTMKVGLPGDMQELTFSVTGHRRLGPLPLVKDEYDAQGEGSVTLLVEGENLWRNPVVTMGTQVADKVELLPNMRGLIVEFKNVPWFTKKNETEQTRDIRVWTSEGAAFAGLVRVHAPVKKAVVKPTKEQSKDAK